MSQFSTRGSLGSSSQASILAHPGNAEVPSMALWGGSESMPELSF